MIKRKELKTIAGTMAIVLPSLLFAQQPGVGIGTQTPHPAAVLHLAAPNNNQGLLLPRLTTAQMEASPFKPSLDASAKGLAVFDTDRNGIYTWDGNAWNGTGGITFPYIDSLVNGTNQSNMVRLQYKGNTGAAVGILSLENYDPNNGYSPLYIFTNSYSSALTAQTTGTGSAGNFSVNNTASSVAALNATTNGTANSVAVRGQATNGGTGVAAFSNGNTFISPAFYAEHTGTGDAAGVFKVSNAANPYNAIFGETVGGGITIYALQKGTGRAGQFQINNAANSEAAVRGFTDGMGRAGFFTINNALNTADAVQAVTNAQGGTALGANNSGNGNAVAIWGGGIRLSTGTLTGGGNISVRNAAYEITGGAAYTISFPLNNGETFFFYNNTAGPVTVNGISIAANSGKTFIVLSNVLRGM